MMTMYPTIDVQLDDGAIMPDRAHGTDAGADVFTPIDVTVPAARANEDGTAKAGFAVLRTGVHVQIPETAAGMLKSKSGLNVKHNIIGEGVIDEGYDGEIVVKLYNLGSEPVHLPAGSKVIQLCVMPVMYPTFRQVDRISGGERGSDGFGSTDNKISRGERL